jgi:hypothetical protein
MVLAVAPFPFLYDLFTCSMQREASEIIRTTVRAVEWKGRGRLLRPNHGVILPALLVGRRIFRAKRLAAAFHRTGGQRAHCNGLGIGARPGKPRGVRVVVSAR